MWLQMITFGFLTPSCICLGNRSHGKCDFIHNLETVVYIFCKMVTESGMAKLLSDFISNIADNLKNIRHEMNIRVTKNTVSRISLRNSTHSKNGDRETIF